MTIAGLQSLEVIVEDTDLVQTVSENIRFHTPRQIKAIVASQKYT
jgi:hypothetical protein